MRQRVADALQIAAGVVLTAAGFTFGTTVGLTVGAFALFGAGVVLERSEDA